MTGVGSLEDLQSRLRAPAIGEDDQALLDLGRRVKENGFLQGMVDFASQRGGTDHLEDYFRIHKVANSASELSDIDAIAHSKAFQMGVPFERAKAAVEHETRIAELGEDSTLTDGEKAYLEVKLKEQGNAARESLAKHAEQWSKTPEQRQADRAEESLQQQEAQRVEAWKPLLDGIVTKPFSFSVEAKGPDGKPTKIDLSYDLSTPERSQEIRALAQQVVQSAQGAQYGDEKVRQQVEDYVRNVYVAQNLQSILEAWSGELLGKAEVTAFQNRHNPPAGSPPPLPPQGVPAGAVDAGGGVRMMPKGWAPGQEG